jgi:hypothetical protein
MGHQIRKSLGTKCHLDVGLMERHNLYYKGEGGGFPQVRVVVNLVNPSSPWLVVAPKVLQLCTNCRNPILAKCGGEAQHSQSWGFGVLRDSRMFRVPQQGPIHLALKCSWCHWKGLEV